MFQDYKEDLFEAYVDAAVRGMSEDEVIWLIEFLDSEEGQKMLKLTRRMSPMYDDAANAVYPRFAEALTKLLMQYVPDQSP